MARKLIRCVVKSDQNTGAVYYVRSRLDWGRPSYTVDAQRTGWHPSAKAAREAAEASDFIYVVTQSGERMLVHATAADYYAPCEA